MRAQKSNVLQHPSFTGPAIVNPVFRGVKKGCPSLGNARRKKIALEMQAAAEPKKRLSETQSNMLDLCHDIISSVLRGECDGLIFSVHRSGAHTFGAVGTYKADKRLAKQVSDEMYAKYRENEKCSPVLQLVGGAK